MTVVPLKGCLWVCSWKLTTNRPARSFSIWMPPTIRREGFHVNHKKVFRIYREEGLAVRRRRGRKRAIGTRQPIAHP